MQSLYEQWHLTSSMSLTSHQHKYQCICFNQCGGLSKTNLKSENFFACVPTLVDQQSNISDLVLVELWMIHFTSVFEFIHTVCSLHTLELLCILLSDNSTQFSWQLPHLSHMLPNKCTRFNKSFPICVCYIFMCNDITYLFGGPKSTFICRFEFCIHTRFQWQ